MEGARRARSGGPGRRSGRAGPAANVTRHGTAVRVHHRQMPNTMDHELLDLGNARQLERFGQVVLDRPCPAAAWHTARDEAAWSSADARFDRDGVGSGAWAAAGGSLPPWPVRLDGLTFEVRLAASGQVGVFPEQVPVWRWLRTWTAGAAGGTGGDTGGGWAVGPGEDTAGGWDAGTAGGPADDTRDTAGPVSATPEILNLFAHTGAASLASAAGGARVVHVDAARPAVAWARRNAVLSGLAEAPIRWIVDDAVAFVRREVRRGRRYAGIVLDPPSYGHGTGSGTWRIEADLAPLLEACAGLLAAGPAFLILTAHTPAFDPDRLGEELGLALGPAAGGGLEVADLGLSTGDGRRVTLGSMARWSR